VAFSRWLRENSEHYLLVDAQRRMAEKYGRSPPAAPAGWRDRFWLRVFAPTYRRLPWRLRRLTIQAMPGSHRRTWTTPPVRRSPAVGPDGRVQSLQSLSTTRSETRGE
jgi:hypothetical protein